MRTKTKSFTTFMLFSFRQLEEEFFYFFSDTQILLLFSAFLLGWFQIHHFLSEISKGNKRVLLWPQQRQQQHRKHPDLLQMGRPILTSAAWLAWLPSPKFAMKASSSTLILRNLASVWEMVKSEIVLFFIFWVLGYLFILCCF